MSAGPDRVALVTGASRGLGAAIAERLGADGHAVAVNYAASRAGADAVVAGIEAAGGRAAAFQADVTDEADVERLLSAVRDRLGPVTTLVLNATGPQPQTAVEDLDWDAMLAQLAFFAKSPVLLTRAVLPDMRAAGGGRIVHVGSDVVQGAPLGNSAYVAAKSAQLGLARVWARELAPHGITVNTVAPGWIPVERHASESDDRRREYAASVPLRRFGTPQEVAAAVAYLASDAAAFVNGAYLTVNGGTALP
jgi:NAD(P)-dependent dehydrogenase (short-subunit alcohol dehydrogenase family)